MMDKKQKDKKVSKKKPNLLNGTVILSQSFIVDQSGQIWWCDPETGIIVKADIRV